MNHPTSCTCRTCIEIDKIFDSDYPQHHIKIFIHDELDKQKQEIVDIGEGLKSNCDGEYASLNTIIKGKA